jgi:replication factor C subunit 1
MTAMKALDLLRADHRQLSQLFDQLRQTDDFSERRELFEEVRDRLEEHSRIEEDIFYPRFSRLAELEELMSESIESMCVADRLSRQIRTNNSWSLLPAQATFAVVVPGTLLALKDTVSIKFPAYLGKKSQHSRLYRGIQQMNIHTRLHAPMSLTELVVDRMSVLKRRLSDPLIKIGSSGISSVIKLMNDYGLSRSDFDLVLELCTFTHSKSSLPLPCISPKVKSAFTRTFNNNNNKINSSHYKKSKSTIQKKDDLKEQKESDDDCDQEEERGSH